MRWTVGVAAALWLWGGLAQAQQGAGTALQQNRAPTDRRWLLAAGVESAAWVTVRVEGLRRLSAIDRRLSIGTYGELPATIWARAGGQDTGRAGGRLLLDVPVGAPGALVVELGSDLSAQDSTLGRFFGWQMQASATPALRFRRWSLGLPLAVRQGLATHVHHGAIVRDAFRDRYESGDSGDGPRDGWIAAPGTRTSAGLAVAVDLTPRWALTSSAALVWTSQRYQASLFDRMMVGLWPFTADVMLAARWP